MIFYYLVKYALPPVRSGKLVFMELCDVLDDGDFTESDDLGLGFGLKPGGLPPLPVKSSADDEELENTVQTPRSLPSTPSPDTALDTTEKPFIYEDQAVKDILSRLSSWTFSNLIEKITSLSRDSRKKKEILQDKVTAGGSIQPSCKKCQKSGQIWKERRRRNSDSALDDGEKRKKDTLRRTMSVREKTWNYFQDHDYKRLQNKLQKAKEEIAVLSKNLELCQKELVDKYGAMKAIHMQSRLEQAQNRKMTKKALEASKQLEQDVNLLQWELELKQSYLMDSEQTWAQRFDRVATENAALLVALHARSEELRKLALDRIALIRERDELAAALEVRDRIIGESDTPNEDGPFTSEEIIVELATLGACQCRGHNQEPCACARAAVEAKRQHARVEKQLEASRNSEDEARLTADAYRMAFDQQLNKNSSLIYELLHKSVPWKKTLLLTRKKQMEPKHDSLDSNEEEFIKLMRTRDDRLVQRLVDMLSDKMEALAHQKMATKMLASKIREQERVIQRYRLSEEMNSLALKDISEHNYEPEAPVTV